MSENPTITATYRTPAGKVLPFNPIVLSFPEGAPPLNPLLECSFVRDEVSERDLMMLSVDPDRHGRPQDLVRAYNALDNEILAGIRAMRGTDGSVPPELPHLVGYHDDPRSPFALLAPYRGEPLATLLCRRQLFEEEQPLFRAGLFRALFLLSSLELVHRDIRPENVRWDERSESVQLTGFTNATVVGVPRSRVGKGPWASHEQREGAGRCDHRDDVWSASLVLVQALTGHEVASENTLSWEGQQELESLLAGVLNRSAAHRPRADELLRKVTGAEALPYMRRMDEHLSHGRDRFDRERAAKRKVLGREPEESSSAMTEGPLPEREHRSEEASAEVPRGHYWTKAILLFLALVTLTVTVMLFVNLV